MMSSDITAFLERRKMILLGGCTIGDPPDADFDKLMRLRLQIAQDHPDCIIMAAIFTPLKVVYGRNKGAKAAVELIDGDDLRSIMALVKQGRASAALEKYFHIWGPPSYAT